MLLGLCLTPVAFTRFRANFDGTLLCSDASESEGGIWESTGLPSRGKQRVPELIADRACREGVGLASASQGRAAVERDLVSSNWGHTINWNVVNCGLVKKQHNPIDL